jgi:xylulose-5-phosphate/fructose-6-phosphate phosphoketolase
MVVRNAKSRYHLCIEAIRCVPRLHDRARALLAEYNDRLVTHHACVREYLQDMPDVRDWVWTDG